MVGQGDLVARGGMGLPPLPNELVRFL
jgi:hypothetical protein